MFRALVQRPRMNCDASPEGVLKPLLFHFKQNETVECDSPEKDTYMIDCMICPLQFKEAKEFCQHMVLEHRIVIADSKMIAYLKGYAEYWKKRFMEHSYTDICNPIVISGKPVDNGNHETNAINAAAGTGDQEEFYLLSDAINEDRLLREKLKRKRLEVVLKQFEKERRDGNFSRSCLFCKKHFTGNRNELFKHIAEDHNLCVGAPNNIVFVEEFLDLLEDKINNKVQCLLCEKIFKDRNTLKEHMRKKQHKKINPKNTEFDKFYLINYLELGKNWEAVQAEDDSEIQDDDENIEELWGDWSDKEFCSVCLFCDCSSPDGEVILLHMKEAHGFNLCKIKKVKNLNFYQQVKLVNYIRRQMYHLCCFNCLRRFREHDDLIQHLIAEKHIDFIPDATMWDQPQYYFPTYENDYLLCFLDDNYDSLGKCEEKAVSCTNLAAAGDSHVVSEEISIPTDSVLWNECLRCQLLS